MQIRYPNDRIRQRIIDLIGPAAKSVDLIHDSNMRPDECLVIRSATDQRTVHCKSFAVNPDRITGEDE